MIGCVSFCGMSSSSVCYLCMSSRHFLSNSSCAASYMRSNSFSLFGIPTARHDTEVFSRPTHSSIRLRWRASGDSAVVISARSPRFTNFSCAIFRYEWSSQRPDSLSPKNAAVTKERKESATFSMYRYSIPMNGTENTVELPVDWSNA
jgi:hypothetical protein